MSTKNLVETPTFNKPNHDTSGRFLGRLGSFGRRILLATGITIAAPVAVEFIGSDKDPAVANASGLEPCDPATERLVDYDDVNGDGEYSPGIDWAYCETIPTTDAPGGGSGGGGSGGGGSGGGGSGGNNTNTSEEPAPATTELMPETSVEEMPVTTEECCADSTAPQESVSATTESECADSTDDCSTITTTSEVAVSEDGENKPGGAPLVVLPIVAGAALIAEQGFRKKSFTHKFLAGLKRRHQNKQPRTKKPKKFNPAV